MVKYETRDNRTLREDMLEAGSIATLETPSQRVTANTAYHETLRIHYPKAPGADTCLPHATYPQRGLSTRSGMLLILTVVTGMAAFHRSGACFESEL